MLTVAVPSDLVSLFTTPGAQVTPLPASYGNILTHLSLEIRLVVCFEAHTKKNHTEICKSKVLFQNKILVTFDEKVTFIL